MFNTWRSRRQGACQRRGLQLSPVFSTIARHCGGAGGVGSGIRVLNCGRGGGAVTSAGDSCPESVPGLVQRPSWLPRAECHGPFPGSKLGGGLIGEPECLLPVQEPVGTDVRAEEESPAVDANDPGRPEAFDVRYADGVPINGSVRHAVPASDGGSTPSNIRRLRVKFNTTNECEVRGSTRLKPSNFRLRLSDAVENRE